MSLYVTSGDGDMAFLASNQGWSDVGDWVDGLDVAAYGAVVQFWEHGIANGPDPLRSQLAAALKAETPGDHTVEKTAAEFLDLLKDWPGGEPVMVSDGFVGNNQQQEAGDKPATFRRPT